ncbi:637_t:CDS:2 [Acaulospora morrowiae]|uniref:637_t:CDS:1 n=1 Tax=Acaulospora morrowiae TaxID=94023 RepID=A0A9N9DB54_9GLOM|nr:637_t:CDS:2 [Acaulospora morrowiae]
MHDKKRRTRNHGAFNRRKLKDLVDVSVGIGVELKPPTKAANVKPSAKKKPPVDIPIPTVKVNIPPAKVDIPPVKVKIPPVKVKIPPAKVKIPPAKVNIPPAKVNIPPAKVNIKPSLKTPIGTGLPKKQKLPKLPINTDYPLITKLPKHLSLITKLPKSQIGTGLPLITKLSGLITDTNSNSTNNPVTSPTVSSNSNITPVTSSTVGSNSTNNPVTSPTFSNNPNITPVTSSTVGSNSTNNPVTSPTVGTVGSSSITNIVISPTLYNPSPTTDGKDLIVATSNSDQTSTTSPTITNVIALPIGSANSPMTDGYRKNEGGHETNTHGIEPYLPFPTLSTNPRYISPYDSRSPYFIPAITGTIVSIILIISIIFIVIKKTVFVKGNYDNRDKQRSFKRLDDTESVLNGGLPTTRNSQFGTIENLNGVSVDLESSMNTGSEVEIKSMNTIDWNECME